MFDWKNQIIEIRVNNFNIEHFKNLGYNLNPNEYIKIRASELSNGSGAKVNVECNYCGKIFLKAYRRCLETSGDFCCKECKNLKMVKTSLRKYGNKCSLRNPVVNKKMTENNIKKYGVPHPLQNKKFREQCYWRLSGGFKFPLVSKMQLYIKDFYGAEINKQVGCYFVDIFIPKHNIAIEYDGGGHNLSVKIGEITQLNFDKKERIRELEILNAGLKLVRIKNITDLNISDDTLTYILNKSIEYFKEYDLFIYDIKTNSENLFRRDELK